MCTFKKNIIYSFRDKETMNSLCLLQICEGLCYFDYLPSNLLQHVFSIEFMEHLDKEILSCYARVFFLRFNQYFVILMHVQHLL